MKPQTYFLMWGAILVVIAVMAGSFLANIVELRKPTLVALDESVKALFNGIAILALYVPAALIALIAATIAKRRSVKSALAVFVIGIAPLAFIYGMGHWDAAIAMSEQKWTAAGLSIALFAMLGLLWVAVSGVLAWLILKFTNPPATL